MNSSKNWGLHVDLGVFKALRKFPRHDAKHILEVIRLLPVNPYFGDVQKMKGEFGVWRRRVGSYRVFYKIEVTEKVILVFRLERRGTTTY